MDHQINWTKNGLTEGQRDSLRELIRGVSLINEGYEQMIKKDTNRRSGLFQNWKRRNRIYLGGFIRWQKIETSLGEGSGLMIRLLMAKL